MMIMILNHDDSDDDHDDGGDHDNDHGGHEWNRILITMESGWVGNDDHSYGSVLVLVFVLILGNKICKQMVQC